MHKRLSRMADDAANLTTFAVLAMVGLGALGMVLWLVVGTVVALLRTAL